jgi:Putative MetA-pathway of phenol degradation
MARGGRATIASVGVAVFLAAPAGVNAQTPRPDLSTLMRNQILDVWQATTPDGSRILVNPPDGASLRTLSPFTLVTQIEQQIGTQLTSLPIGSSAGGFTYRYDSHLGTFTRTTETFGPAFAERAQVLGRHRVNFGMSYQHGRYSTLDGRDLEGGAIRFVLPPGTLTDPAFGNVIDSELHLRLSSDTMVFFTSAGVTDRLDIGVAVPYQRVSMNLTSRATIRDFSTRTVSPVSRVFVNGGKSQDFATSGDAEGIGDVVVRGKYKLTRPGLREFAVCVDVRLPTGDAANFLGAGSTQTQVLLVSSYSSSRIDPHFNVGYTFTHGHAADQINSVLGVEVAASRRITVIGDLIGRMFLDTLQLRDSLVQIVQPGDSARGVPAVVSTAFGTVETYSGWQTSTLGTIGVKFNPIRSVLISAHVIATLTDHGLRRRVAPVFGLDYSF